MADNNNFIELQGETECNFDDVNDLINMSYDYWLSDPKSGINSDKIAQFKRSQFKIVD